MNCDNLSHLTEREQRAVRAYVDALRSQHDGSILTIAFFGSKARGDGEPDSDIDVLVVTERDDWRLWWDLVTVAAEVSLEYDVLLDPHVIGRERWAKMAQEHDPLWQNICGERIVLLTVEARRGLT
jgi:predicted nucleotidyltransferase